MQGDASLMSEECHTVAVNVTACTFRGSYGCLKHQRRGSGMSSLGGAVTITLLLQASRGAQAPPVPDPQCGSLQLWFSPAAAPTSCVPL